MPTTPVVEQLTRRWVAAWANLRRLELGEVAGWPLVYVGSASRTTEIVCAEPDPGTWSALLGRVAAQPAAMLSVVSSHPETYVADLPGGLRLDRDDETLMLLDHSTVLRSSQVDVGRFHVDRDADADRLTLRLVSEGRVAAEGTAGLLGHDAVYDMVETSPKFRRQGLAGWVMCELSREMVTRGATTGLLAATPEGGRLYRRLGWTDVAPMRSLVGA